MNYTVSETIEGLHRSLRDYIEATYHISNPAIVRQRQTLLDQLGVIRQEPYLESTPRYVVGNRFEDLCISEPVKTLFRSATAPDMNGKTLFVNPPYSHQEQALLEACVHERSLVITTGTGSGKTECFLLPILAKLAEEASLKQSAYANAVRAIILYPMNALVNDQLGRLRLLFGDPRISDVFKGWIGRPARFARYTSRTLYAGVRTPKRDQTRLKAIYSYYVKLLEQLEDGDSSRREQAARLIRELKSRGKWPAKADLRDWYGQRNQRWFDEDTGEFRRCITQIDDSELLTRHEVLANAPDVLITNYSMLEYMLMRPIERAIFDGTASWLAQNPDYKFLLIVDEAHLYRGAPGTEVALLIRRLRKRLGISEERLQVICTSASFRDGEKAREFGANLSGKNLSHFVTVSGKYVEQRPAAPGTPEDVSQLKAIDIVNFLDCTDEDAKLTYVRPFLEFRKVNQDNLHRGLYDALIEYSPLGYLVNCTMGSAQPLRSLAAKIFPGVDVEDASIALSTLLALGSFARRDDGNSSMLPCRVHSFHRGLVGLWACLNQHCPEEGQVTTSKVIGRLYSQPRETCECGSRVFELFTCRNCGTAYARAYTDNVVAPTYLWSIAGEAYVANDGHIQALQPLDLLLESPSDGELVEPADLDLVSGVLNPQCIGRTCRQVFLRKERTKTQNAPGNRQQPQSLGEFRPCGVCGQTAAYGRSSVQDHQTKGDEPFQTLILRQIQSQAPTKAWTSLAPLRGRKTLVFADSRQMAAKLAPKIHEYSLRDAVRALLFAGFKQLQSIEGVRKHLTLDDCYFAVLWAAASLKVRLRPEFKPDEHFFEHFESLQELIEKGQPEAVDVLTFRSHHAPEALLSTILNCLTHPYYGLHALALASFAEADSLTSKLQSLESLRGLAETPEQKTEVVRLWLQCWSRPGIELAHTPKAWFSDRIEAHSGKFDVIERVLGNRSTRQVFETQWLPELVKRFAVPVGDRWRLKGTAVTLDLNDRWGYCKRCRSAQRPFGECGLCTACGKGEVERIDPEKDPVFLARKQYYRLGAVEASMNPPTVPVSLIAKEHTAQLNTAGGEDIYSLAEQHELLFQDVVLDSESVASRPAIDVLCCTTTMEVGIDIGALSAVALRNMPPARANYQQRAGRAGRRGIAVATVTAFGSSDSHDEHYFSHPEEMISGLVDDPSLTLHNDQIAKRHIMAYVLQEYCRQELKDLRQDAHKSLFEVLGTVEEFKGEDSPLNRAAFERWLSNHEARLRAEVDSWLPHEVPEPTRGDLLTHLKERTLSEIDKAIGRVSNQGNGGEQEGDEVGEAEVVDEVHSDDDGTYVPKDGQFLDTLLFKGILPRYAFPTDVATFYVFDKDKYTVYQPAFLFAPSQGLSIALSQYAPGKDLWIAGRKWRSGALYSPFPDDRLQMWTERQLYFECSICGFAVIRQYNEGERGERLDCPACRATGKLGPSKVWLRPAGFAHPHFRDEQTSHDVPIEPSYASRAKMYATGPAALNEWNQINSNVRTYFSRQQLLVTNTGSSEEGFSYCTTCGLIEPVEIEESALNGQHLKPYPDQQQPNCTGSKVARKIVLGTQFVTDVLLIAISVDRPNTLKPGVLATDVALRTVGEAIARAACRLLGLDSNELQAEYRPALTDKGPSGKEAEIYLYDTLPGGAGFSRLAGQFGVKLFEEALGLLENCLGACDMSCYRCLRSFRNKREHSLLDRHLGASLLRHVLHGERSTMNPRRLSEATDMLHADLIRRGIGGLNIVRGGTHLVPGIGQVEVPIKIVRTDCNQVFIVCLTNPLAPKEPLDEKLQLVRTASPIGLIPVDELSVRRNLPHASNSLLQEIGI